MIRVIALITEPRQRDDDSTSSGSIPCRATRIRAREAETSRSETVQPGMKKERAIAAPDMAWLRRHPNSGLIFHPDREGQCCSADGGSPPVRHPGRGKAAGGSSVAGARHGRGVPEGAPAPAVEPPARTPRHGRVHVRAAGGRCAARFPSRYRLWPARNAHCSGRARQRIIGAGDSPRETARDWPPAGGRSGVSSQSACLA